MDIHTGLTAVHRTWTAVDMGRGVACSLVRGGDLDVRRVVRVSPKVPGVDRATLRRGISAIQEEMRIDAEFPAAALAEAEEAARNPVLPGLDRTDIPFLTIDPESARDLDQALHIERRDTLRRRDESTSPPSCHLRKSSLSAAGWRSTRSALDDRRG